MARQEPEGSAGGERLDAALRRGARYLERRGVEHGLRNARFLLAHSLGVEASLLAGRLGELLPGPARRRYARLLCARGRRLPLQHLLGRWEFYGIDLLTGPEALVPRPETEVLVERVLEALPGSARLGVDVGTGTGAIAIALALRRERLELWAIDCSAAALGLAGRNLARHGLLERVHLIEGRDLEPLVGCCRPASLDLVVSNPPYLRDDELAQLEPEVRDHEPRQALVGGPSGLEAYQRLVPQAAGWLRPGGLLAFELGAGQAAAVAGLVAASGAYAASRLHADLAGFPRVLLATRR